MKYLNTTIPIPWYCQSEKFEIESWGKYKEFSKFKLNKKGLENLIIKINSLEEKDYIIFESDENNLILYY